MGRSVIVAGTTARVLVKITITQMCVRGVQTQSKPMDTLFNQTLMLNYTLSLNSKF